MIKNGRKTRNKKIIIIGLALILLLVVLGTKSYLYVNLLIGNDLVVLMDVNKQNFLLEHGDTDRIKIKISAITNPFCTAICSSEFIDLSRNSTIETDNFKLKTSPISKEFEIYPEIKGKWQKMYQFRISCNNVKTYLCNTNENLKIKNALFTVDYDLNEHEKNAKENSGERIKFIGNNIGKSIYELNEISRAFYEFNNTTISDDFKNRIENSKENLDRVYNETLILKQSWENENYYGLENRTQDTETYFYDAMRDFDYIKHDFLGNASLYNNMTENLTEIKEKLKGFQNIKVSLITYDQAIKLNNSFSDLIISFHKKDYIYKKYDLINNFAADLWIVSEMISNDIKNIINPEYEINLTLGEFNFPRIESNFSANNFSFRLEEPQAVCCFLGKCEECCDNECKNDESKFPVVLVHGHSFNEKVSAEYSLDVFSNMQKRLEDDGHINAGSFYFASYDNSSGGILGRMRNPFSFKASYYFDVLNNKDQNIIIETKTDNIDTYAIRLNDIIKNIKYKTNRDKVIVIAHSMGGLVLRRYIQIFGSNDIDKVILIGAPNHGINDRILKICNLFGTEAECRDMSHDSLFINKLNSMSTPDVTIHNIIGVGCRMDENNGDGIVEEDSAYLEHATNYYVIGTCNEIKFDLLHNNLVSIGKHPEVYDIISKILRQD